MKTSTRLVLILMLVALSGPVTSGQTPGTARVMREKLGHSQKILEAILTRVQSFAGTGRSCRQASS